MTLERSWRLLPSERVLWQGRPAKGVARDPEWLLGALLAYAFATIAALFSALLFVTDLPGTRQTGIMAAYLAIVATGIALAPRFLHDSCEYLVTDRRVMWRRGRVQRWIERHAISYGRITWSRSASGVGHLELVRATPFGPLSRKQRLVLLNVIAPDRVLACIRGVEASENLGDPELPITDRLDAGEHVLWGGGPQGFLLGVRDLATAVLGAGVSWLALRYGGQVATVLIDLERLGLQVRSWTWLLLFLAAALSFCVIACAGVWLVWRGLIRARAMGRDTEYVVTNKRVLIRRGRIELSLDRKTIVDVAVVPVADGSRHVFLILDAPEARALSDSGALMPMPPARDIVPPVLYELKDTDQVCELLLNREGERLSQAA
jgi:hypothetical protein